ncbi:YqeG family HAD IIIA-type phosphatase [Culicoidibacter larvae]|uniref:YqeG family HAD IIIA-type phosphatase n=1 Tax=Culicoidibacter larvae TaxID=2579976 RepID=A0A5R8QFA2_9FIRM|nr:YqeG family HAD IIIA-type phosphatase [Culicoidibacter larvae]TLG76652.1 YqeG family HAD IIIA-type phosphatase [Culicoidibacter larvae]
MSLVRPYVMVDSILDIEVEWLQEKAVTGLFVDIDNTVFASHDAPNQPIRAEFKAKLGEFVDARISVVLISNNRRERVAAIAGQVGLPYVSFAIKPLPFGFLRAKRKLALPRKHIMHIGDQLLTDVIGAQLCGIRAILVEPLVDKDNIFAKPSRLIERVLGTRKNKRSELDE